MAKHRQPTTIHESGSCTCSERGTSTIFLPDPNKPNFGIRTSRWARSSIAMIGDHHCSSVDKNDEISQFGLIPIGDVEELFDVSIGFWNTLGQPRHMELEIELHRVSSEKAKPSTNNNDDEQDEEKVRNRKKKQHHRPVWVLNSHMGGTFSMSHSWYDPTKSYHTNSYGRSSNNNDECIAEKFSSSMKASRAPSAINPHIKKRWYGMNGLAGKHHIFRTYRMKGSTFLEMIRRFLRWSFVIGQSDLFQFNVFLFINKTLQQFTNSDNSYGQSSDKDKKDTKDFMDSLRFINCQASVALFALWWLREAEKDKGVVANKQQNNNVTRSANIGNNDTTNNIDTITTKMCSLVFPRVSYRKNFKGISITKWRQSIREKSRQQLNEFLNGAAVRRALLSSEFNDEETVSKAIKAYSKNKENKSQDNVIVFTDLIKRDKKEENPKESILVTSRTAKMMSSSTLSSTTATNLSSSSHSSVPKEEVKVNLDKFLCAKKLHHLSINERRAIHQTVHHSVSFDNSQRKIMNAKAA